MQDLRAVAFALIELWCALGLNFRWQCKGEGQQEDQNK